MARLRNTDWGAHGSSPAGSHASRSRGPGDFDGGTNSCDVVGAGVLVAIGDARALGTGVSMEDGGGGWDVHATTKASRAETMSWRA